jgi:hypothetical protein
VLEIHRLLVSIEDTSGVKPEIYGSGVALTNGITVQVQASDNTVISDLTDGVPVKTNALWSAQCFDVDAKAWGNTPTDEVVVVRWTFSKSGVPILLEDGQKLVVTLNDNLSGLVGHYFQAQGFYRNRSY